MQTLLPAPDSGKEIRLPLTDLQHFLNLKMLIMGNQLLPGCRKIWATGIASIIKSVLLLFVCGFSSTALWAQTITVDGNPVDWPAVLNSNNTSIVKTFVHDASQTNDNQFTQGSSDVDLIEQWRWSNGQTNNKGDILNTGAALIGTKLYFFGDRFAINGDAQIGFWFFHNNVAPLANGTFSGTHAIGDLLILSNFTNGGGGVQIRVFKWVGSGGAFGQGQFDSIPLGTSGGADVNGTNYPVPTTVSGWTYTSKAGPANTYVMGSFFEGFVDLAAIGADPCFQSFLMETRNSQSLTASQQDLAAGQFHVMPDVHINVTLKTGVTAGSPQTGCPRVFNINSNLTNSLGLKATGAATYTWTITKSNGSAPGSEITFTVNGNDTATFTINNILATENTYRIIVSGAIVNNCTDKDTICIQPTGGAPPCGVSGPDTVCPKSTNYWFYDPDHDGVANPIPTNFTATWSLINNTNGATLGTPTASGDSVPVTASATCGGTGFRVKLVLASSSGLTTINCSDSATVGVKSALAITCPRDTTLTCGASTAPASTGTATVPDNGCGVKVSYSDVITRTWTATDACGNTRTCTQTITVPGPCVTSNTIPPDPPAARMITSAPTLVSPAGSGTVTNQTVKTDKPAPLTPTVTSLGSGLKVQAFPNPFRNTINFRFTSEVSGRAVLQVFNSMGQLVGIAYDGMVDAGVMQSVQFTTRLTNQTLIYRLKVGTKTVRGTVLELNR